MSLNTNLDGKFLFCVMQTVKNNIKKKTDDDDVVREIIFLVRNAIARKRQKRIQDIYRLDRYRRNVRFMIIDKVSALEIDLVYETPPL